MEAVFATLGRRDREITALGRAYLAAAKLRDSLEELVPFLLRDTGKTAVAGYAHLRFRGGAQGDRRGAPMLLDEAAAVLAQKGRGGGEAAAACEAGARGVDGRSF